MTRILNFLFLSLLILSCTQNKNELVSNPEDYVSFLETSNENLSDLENQVALWRSKIAEEPRGFTFYEKLGSSYHQLFEKTGEITYLYQANQAFEQANQLTRGKWKVPSLLSLSSLAIKRHDFKSAAQYAVTAREFTDEKFGPLLMQFDAEMELGNFEMAGAILKENRRMDSFDYLVRLSKYKDYEGDLDSAIYFMEEAQDLLLSYQKERKLWATANLADMYGHAGRVKNSYEKYLEVLALDSSYDYALKGIAWVAYSHDKNPKEGIAILEKLQTKTAMPDHFLLMSEMSEFGGDSDKAEWYKTRFLEEATKSEYAGMYNKYLIEIYLEKGAFVQAMELAEEEVQKRPTPAAYDWMAWTLYKQGEVDKAIELYQNNVEDQTYEPDVIYHMGVVYYNAGKANGRDYLLESLEASYELGPLTEQEIRQELEG